MGRPLREINWDVVEKLIETGCSALEISGKFKIDKNTFYDRFKRQYGCSFADYSPVGQSGGKADIRSMLYAKAMSNKAPGNAQVLIFLARCELGMKEVESVQTLAANQPQIDQAHELMMARNEIEELKQQIKQLKCEPQTILQEKPLDVSEF